MDRPSLSHRLPETFGSRPDCQTQTRSTGREVCLGSQYHMRAPSRSLTDRERRRVFRVSASTPSSHGLYSIHQVERSRFHETRCKVMESMSSAADAVSVIQSGMNVFVHGAAATPTPLLEAIVARTDLQDVTFYHLHTNGQAPHVSPGVEGRFRAVSLFTGGPLREAVAAGRADFVPIFLSDIPALFTSGRVKLDAALLHLSPPD